MHIQYNNRLFVTDNAFPSYYVYGSGETYSEWTTLPYEKANFVDDEHIQVILSDKPVFSATALFRIEYDKTYQNSNGVKKWTRKYYQIEKIDKIANGRVLVSLRIEPYLSYILYDGHSPGNDQNYTPDDNNDLAQVFRNTNLNWIRSPFLTYQSLQLRDPLMDSIVKGCNRVVVREQHPASRQNYSLELTVPCDFLAPVPNWPTAPWDATKQKANEEWFRGIRIADSGSPLGQQYIPLGFWLGAGGNEGGEGWPVQSTKYAVFVIPASDWNEILDELDWANAFMVRKDPNTGKPWFDSNAGSIGLGISAYLRSDKTYKPTNFLISTIKGLYDRNNRFVRLRYIPIGTKVSYEPQYESFNSPRPTFEGSGRLFENQDVILKVPVWDNNCNITCNGNTKSYIESDTSTGLLVDSQFCTFNSFHSELRLYNSYGMIQQNMLKNAVQASGTAFTDALSLNKYYKGIFHGQAYNKNTTPVIISYPPYKEDKVDANKFIETKRTILGFLSTYSGGEEWELDLNNFVTARTGSGEQKWLSKKSNNIVYNWGNAGIEKLEDSQSRSSWQVDHIYLKQYLDFTIGSEVFNLSAIFGALYGTTKYDRLNSDGCIYNSQFLKVKTYFINGFVNTWILPNSFNYPNASVYTSRIAYGSPATTSEYQNWLTANSNVLESGKANAGSSLIAGIASGLSNMLTGGMNAVWAPDIGSKFTSSTPNLASGLNAITSSVANYTNTIRSLNAQKADAKNSSGATILPATTDFVPAEMLSKQGVLDGETRIKIGGYTRRSPYFVQTAVVNDLSKLISMLKQTLYYNSYYGPTRGYLRPDRVLTEMSKHKHPYFYELVDDNVGVKIGMQLWRDVGPSYDTGLLKGYDGNKWLTWYINKLQNGVCFYNTIFENGYPNSTTIDNVEPIYSSRLVENKNDKPKVKTKKKTKKN